VLKAARETETTQKNIQDWLGLDKGDPAFQLLTNEEISAVIFIFISTTYIITFSTYLCCKFLFCLLGLSFASLIPIIGQSG
jgi:hypothetical protein